MFQTALSRTKTNPRFTVRDPFFSLMDRFFSEEGLGNLTQRGENGDNRSWLPPVDIVETDTAFVATVDLPGLTKNDVELSLEDNMLTLAGERTFDNTDESAKFRRVERSYGSFSRTFTLPPGVDAGKVEATFEHGVLTLTMPKSETAKPRKIDIA